MESKIFFKGCHLGVHYFLPQIVFSPEWFKKMSFQIISKIIAYNHILSVWTSCSTPLPRHALPSAVQIIPLVCVWQAIILAPAGAEVGSEILQFLELRSWWTEEQFVALKLSDASAGVLCAPVHSSHHGKTWISSVFLIKAVAVTV